MNTELERRKQEITRSQGRRKLWQRIVSALAAVVMFVTTYVLILPVEAQNRTFCEMEAHEHSAENGCYVETKTLKCEEKHEHTDECYITLLTLICQHEEHTHNKECYADKTADIETQADWEASIKAAKLTGNWSEDILAIANTQLGYRESDKNYIVNEENEIQGYNRYAAWVSSTNAEFGQYSPWSAAFVAFCLHFAKVDEAELQRTPYPAQWGELMKAYEKLNADAKNAQSGDILFIDENDDGKADRVAIVVENGDGKIKAVEGDLNNSVAYSEYILGDASAASRTAQANVEFSSENSKNKDFAEAKSTTGRTVGKIIGFVALPENPNYTAPIDSLDPNTTAEPENREKTIILTAETENGVTVTLTADADTFDAPANELELSVSVVNDEKALALLKQAAADTNYTDNESADSALPAQTAEDFSNEKSDNYRAEGADKDFSNEKSNNSAAAVDPADQAAEDFSGEKSGETEKASFSSLILDIKALYNKEETQPKNGNSVKITLSGDAVPGGYAQVYYLDIENETVQNMNALLGESGLFFNTPHFSIFGITSSKQDATKSFSGTSAQKVQLTTNDSYYARALPFATVVIDYDKLRLQDATLEYTPNSWGVQYHISESLYFPLWGKEYFSGDYCCVYADGYTINPGDHTGNPNIFPPLTIVFPEAAILADGSRADLAETFVFDDIIWKENSYYASRFLVAFSGTHISHSFIFFDGVTNNAMSSGGSSVNFDTYMSHTWTVRGAADTDTIIMRMDDCDGNGVATEGGYRYIVGNSAASKFYATPSTYLNFHSTDAKPDASNLSFASRYHLPTYTGLHDEGQWLAKAVPEPSTYTVYAVSNYGDDYATVVRHSSIFIRPQYKILNSDGSLTDWIPADENHNLNGQLEQKLQFKDITPGSAGETVLWDSISPQNDGYVGRAAAVGKDIECSISDAIPGYYIERYTNTIDGVENELNVVNGKATIMALDGENRVDAYYVPITGSITITKYDSKTNELLTGAEFTLTGKSSLIPAQGSADGSFTITSVDNGDGTYTISNIPVGLATDNYILTETQAPTQDAHGNPTTYYAAGPWQYTGDQFDLDATTGDPVELTQDVYNSSEPVTLTVNKQVVGNDLSVKFPFTISITDSTGSSIYVIPDSDIKVYGANNNDITPANITRDASNNPVIALGNGERIVIENIPPNFKATIAESDFDGYTSEISSTDSDIQATSAGSGATKPISMNKDRVVNFRNTRNTVELTISKTVVGGGTGPFGFEITFADASGDPVNIPAPAANSGYTVTNNVASFDLNKDGSVTITGIPVGTIATIVETSHNGYTVQYNFSDGTPSVSGDTASVTITDDLTVTCINNAGFELPHTGGTGSLILTLGGVILVATALMYGISAKRRQWRAWI